MEAVKEVFAVIGVIVGVLTGLLTLYAKYLDLKKKAAREADDREPPAATPKPRRDQEDEFDEPPVVPRSRAPEPAAIAHARELVRRPAMAMMIAGGLSLMFNLFMSGFGFVDEFVTPLSTTSKERRHVAGDAKKAEPAAKAEKAGGVADARSDRASAVMAIVMLLSFSVASGTAIWAGYNMLRLRSYWVSVAGSFAVMPGACLCCLAGIPVGIWSLTVLLKPEVSATFR